MRRLALFTLIACLGLFLGFGVLCQAPTAVAGPSAGLKVYPSSNPEAAWAVDGNKIYYLQRSGSVLSIVASAVIADATDLQLKPGPNATTAWAFTGRKVFFVEKDGTAVLKIQASASL